MMRMAWLVMITLAVAMPAYAADVASRASIYAPATTRPSAAVEPIHLEPGPHLFIDDFLIAESHNVRRVVNRPERDAKIRNPIISGKEDGCFQPYMTILRDPTQKFRIWYGARTADSNPSRSRLGYMESNDGIRWQRPHRVLETPFIQFGASVLDEGPAFADSQQRFKFAWWAPATPKGGLPGMKLAASPDGFIWSQMKKPGAADDVILAHNHDINSIFRDPIRKLYIAIASTHVTDPAWSGERRVTTQSVSDDLMNWQTPWRVVVPDPRVEHDQTQFYAMDGFLVRGGLLIGMVKVLRDDLKADDPPDPPDAYGIGYTALAWSRDGEHWTRDREAFFDRDSRKGAWDHAHTWIDEQVPVGDEIFLYYGGYARGHKVNRFEERQIGLVQMKRDRYVAREAGDESGTIMTPSIVLGGHELTINADAADGGEIRVQVLDAGGKAIEGFTFADAEPITRDGLGVPVKWKRELKQIARRPVRLAFQMKHARLFAIDVR
ncbi:MAG: hypothetical protein QOF78_3983 [Phycisphaerales bacterium]|nr:hypothetical protein [Phycisphaerales bacterium]